MIDVPSRLLAIGGRIVLLPVRVLRWLLEQLVGTARNASGVLTRSSLDDLPPWISGTIRWVGAQLPRAAGAGTPREQIVASIVLAFAMIVASFGVLTWIAPIFAIPLAIGLLRLVPVANDKWGGLRSRSSRTRRKTSRKARTWRRK